MQSHRDLYPAQYEHPLCGKRVRTADGKVSGTVERVVASRFGPLAILKEHGAEQSWAVNTLTVVDWNERGTIEALPMNRLPGWTMTYEYPGVWTWSHPSRPEGQVAATPFWNDDATVPVDWQTDDGETQPLASLEYAITGDVEQDAATYVNLLAPVLKAILDRATSTSEY
jgi:hypothetical protein